MSCGLQHRSLTVNGIRMHTAEQGSGPLIVLCHGWPELWYSWRHQLPVLAQAGFHVVAPDMRGFGATDAPEDSSAYTILHTVGDIVGLVAALGERSAIVIGHDWGRAGGLVRGDDASRSFSRCRRHERAASSASGGCSLEVVAASRTRQ